VGIRRDDDQTSWEICSAARDLEELDAYITENDSPAAADHVLGKIEEAVAALSEFPKRGTYPQELSSLGVHEYREAGRTNGRS